MIYEILLPPAEHAPEDGELEGDEAEYEPNDVDARINKANDECQTNNEIANEETDEKPAFDFVRLAVARLVEIAREQPEISHADGRAENKTEEKAREVKSAKNNHNDESA